MVTKTVDSLYRHDLSVEYIHVVVAAGDGGIQEDSNGEAEKENSDQEGEGRSHESSEGQAGGGETTGRSGRSMNGGEAGSRWTV